MSSYPYFLLVSYATALFFEFIANNVGDGILFSQPNWFVFFIIWYGAIYSVLFLLFRKSEKLWKGVVFFAAFGTVLEIIVFKRSNLIVDPIIYGLMALAPLGAYRKKFRGEAHAA